MDYSVMKMVPMAFKYETNVLNIFFARIYKIVKY